MTAKQLHAAIERAPLNPELSKAQIRRITAKAFTAGLIGSVARDDVQHVLNDRDQCAEDALDILKSYAGTFIPATAPTLRHSRYGGLPELAQAMKRAGLI